MQACQMAAAWRARFQRDAVVELVGYRRCALRSSIWSSLISMPVLVLPIFLQYSADAAEPGMAWLLPLLSRCCLPKE